MNPSFINSYAKINLTLGVNGKLRSGYHKIESLISFIDLHDKIRIERIKNKKHKIKFVGKFSKGINKKNSIFKLLKILDKYKLLKNQKYYIKINKNIPLKAGLGGGSMNASSVLKFFLSKKIIKISKKNIFLISELIGSDVKVGLNYKNIILYSNGKIKVSSKKLRFNIIVAKPNFGCSTKEIYNQVRKFSKIKLLNNKNNYFNLKQIIKLPNDLERIAFKKYPKLNKINLFLTSLPNIQLSRMTGSGSVIIGYFLSLNDAKKAAKLFKNKYKNYWCIVSKTI
tara:strand:- start:31 stop:879 length:849 start_codon:yes stop_codon:yes gene_type:complete